MIGFRFFTVYGEWVAGYVLLKLFKSMYENKTVKIFNW